MGRPGRRLTSTGAPVRLALKGDGRLGREHAAQTVARTPSEIHYRKMY
jgi:hypothetical protein